MFFFFQNFIYLVLVYPLSGTKKIRWGVDFAFLCTLAQPDEKLLSLRLERIYQIDQIDPIDHELCYC